MPHTRRQLERTGRLIEVPHRPSRLANTAGKASWSGCVAAGSGATVPAANPLGQGLEPTNSPCRTVLFPYFHGWWKGSSTLSGTMHGPPSRANASWLPASRPLVRPVEPGKCLANGFFPALAAFRRLVSRYPFYSSRSAPPSSWRLYRVFFSWCHARRRKNGVESTVASKTRHHCVLSADWTAPRIVVGRASSVASHATIDGRHPTPSWQPKVMITDLQKFPGNDGRSPLQGR